MSLLADDTILDVTANTFNEAVEKINSDLQELYRWLCMNKHMLNTRKTKWILFNPTRHLSRISGHELLINGEPTKRVASTKYLGVIIDEKMAFHDHFDHLIKKTAQKVGLFYRISRQLTCVSRRTVYRYCSSILFLRTQEDINHLQVIQNRAMKITTAMNRFTPIKEMVERLDVLMIEEQIKFNTLVPIFKIKNNLTPDYLSRKIRLTSQITTRNLRRPDEIRLPSRNERIDTNSIFFKGVILFNNFSHEIKGSSHLNSFKIELSKYLRDQRVE